MGVRSSPAYVGENPQLVVDNEILKKRRPAPPSYQSEIFLHGEVISEYQVVVSRPRGSRPRGK